MAELMQLSQLEQLQRALISACNSGDVTGALRYNNQLSLLQSAVKLLDDNLDELNAIMIIRVICFHHLGMLLNATFKHGGARDGDQDTLEAHGITKYQSSSWRALAAVSLNALEAELNRRASLAQQINAGAMVAWARKMRGTQSQVIVDSERELISELYAIYRAYDTEIISAAQKDGSVHFWRAAYRLFNELRKACGLPSAEQED